MMGLKSKGAGRPGALSWPQAGAWLMLVLVAALRLVLTAVRPRLDSPWDRGEGHSA
jgi:hypothetical protein